MPPIVTTAEIGRPAADVFAYATDPARFSEWQKGVVDGHMDGAASGTHTLAAGAKCVREHGSAQAEDGVELSRAEDEKMADQAKGHRLRSLARLLLPGLGDARAQGGAQLAPGRYAELGEGAVQVRADGAVG
jgi:hypothetical protein